MTRCSRGRKARFFDSQVLINLDSRVKAALGVLTAITTAGALNAAFRSLSPPRTAANVVDGRDGRDEPLGSSGSSQARDAKSMPTKSPMRSPLASARSLPDNALVFESPLLCLSALSLAAVQMRHNFW